MGRIESGYGSPHRGAIDQAIATEIHSQSLLMNTEDFAEATRAFIEKRKPHFTGR
jgi:enoyl-CoA hydratase/carnithine racemase